MKPMVVLMRHGETDWNKEARLMSRTDLPMSGVGIEQVKRVAAINKLIKIDEIICSPLKRAAQTAGVFRSVLHSAPTIRFDDRLRELDFGAFEGLTAVEIRASELASDYSNWQSGLSFDIGSAESFSDGAKRAADVLSEVEVSGGTRLIVSHGYLCRALLADAVLKCPPSSVKSLRFDNARLATVEIESGTRRLTSFNVFDLSTVQDDKPTS